MVTAVGRFRIPLVRACENDGRFIGINIAVFTIVAISFGFPSPLVKPAIDQARVGFLLLLRKLDLFPIGRILGLITSQETTPKSKRVSKQEQPF